VQRYLEVFDRVLQGRRPAVAVTAAGGGSA
jgi:hypothetical protein